MGHVLGVDIGGTGIKAAPVDLDTGTLLAERVKLDTPHPAEPAVGPTETRGKEAEKRASEIVREEHELSWGKWAGRVDEYLEHMEMLLSPQLIIIGGGISRKSDKFLPLLTGLRATVVPAKLHNDAGIVGAAMAAARANQLTRHGPGRYPPGQ